MTFSLGIDIGTSGVKTASLNAEGEIFSTSNIKHIKQNSDKINPSVWCGLKISNNPLNASILFLFSPANSNSNRLIIVTLHSISN